VDGNLLTRTATSGAGQSLSWDDEGHLASVTATGTNPGVTKYLYDADGNQLIRRDPGRTTLFAGDTQIVIDTSVNPPVSLGADRTYTLGGSGAAIAQRSTLPGGGTFYLFNDPHGTATLAMDTTTQKVAASSTSPTAKPETASTTRPGPTPPTATSAPRQTSPADTPTSAPANTTPPSADSSASTPSSKPATPTS
jgi:YD repeat-containing protein